MVDSLGTPGTADKNLTQALGREHVSQADEWHITFKTYRLLAGVDCVLDCLLLTAAKRPHQSTGHLNGSNCVLYQK